MECSIWVADETGTSADCTSTIASPQIQEERSGWSEGEIFHDSSITTTILFFSLPINKSKLDTSISCSVIQSAADESSSHSFGILSLSDRLPNTEAPNLFNVRTGLAETTLEKPRFDSVRKHSVLVAQAAGDIFLLIHFDD